MKKGVVAASKGLPPTTRKSFIRAFQACEVLDLYNGRFEDYLSVIAQTLESRGRKIKKLENNCDRARAILVVEGS